MLPHSLSDDDRPASRRTWAVPAARPGWSQIVVLANHAAHVVPATAAPRLRFVPLDDEVREPDDRFARDGLWPLCHDVGLTPAFRTADFTAYRDANRQAATAVLADIHAPALLVVQDHRLALVPHYLRALGSDHALVTFWPLPWPRPRPLSRCPWAPELLRSLLASHIVGFQTHEDRANFLTTIEALDGTVVDALQGRVAFGDHHTAVRVYPAGVEPPTDGASRHPVGACRALVRRQLGLDEDTRLIVGVDRLDDTQGLDDKVCAVERLLATRPGAHARVVFLQIATPRPEPTEHDRAAADRLRVTVTRVNARGNGAEHPAIVLREALPDGVDLPTLARAADVWYVGSLHDGMHLGAKAFVAARDDERGVLVLSEGAGAARQLRAALIIDPRRTDQAAQALERALAMSAGEQATRMRVLRANVASFDAAWWGRQIVNDVRLERPGPG